MIVSLSGKIQQKTPTEVVVNVNGLGYLCFISNNTYDKIGQIGDSITLKTYLQISENLHSLFGFYDLVEKNLFEMLISVSGIGPKIAINLLSAVTPDEFKRRLIAGEVSMLTTLPGIGPKTARRIIVELKDKFVDVQKDELPKEDELSDNYADAYDALITLGFQPQNIRNSIHKLNLDENLSTQEIIKKILLELKK